MDEREQQRVNELAKAYDIDPSAVKGIQFYEGYWVVDDVNSILYLCDNPQFKAESLLLDLFSLKYVPVGDTYTIFLGENRYFIAVENKTCADKGVGWK